MRVKLFYKIFVAFLVVSLFPVLLGSQLFTTKLEEYLEQSIRNEAMASLHKTATLINSTIKQFDQTLQKTARYLLLRAEDKETLQWVYHLHPEIDKLVAVNMDGTVQHAISRYEHIPMGLTLAECSPKSLEHAKINKINFVEWDNVPHICFRNPIISLADGAHKGALFAAVNFHSLLEVIIASKNSGHDQFLVNADSGKVVFHSDFNLVLSAKDATTIPVVQRLRNQSDFSSMTYKNFHGKKVVGAAIAIPETPLYLIDEVPYQRAFALLNKYEQLRGWVVGSGIVFILITAFLFSRSITKPISRLLAATSKIEAGDFDTSMPPLKNRFVDE